MVYSKLIHYPLNLLNLQAKYEESHSNPNAESEEKNNSKKLFIPGDTFAIIKM